MSDIYWGRNMTKIDWRLLLIVASAFVTATSVVVLAKHTSSSNLVSLVEVVAPKGAAVNDIIVDGMQMEVSAKGLAMRFPGCKMDPFRDRFFLHVYTKEGLKKTPAEYINLDFSLEQSSSKVVVTGDQKSCVYFKSFSDYSPQLVNMGQYTTPGGRCCEITWSRSWVFDEGLLAPK